jgi:hypothetical protein
MATTNQYPGNCFICGETVNKRAIKTHIMKKHSKIGQEPSILIKAEGLYSPCYWLYFSVLFDEPLRTVDRFLRRIWCECCGHCSQFLWNKRDEIDDETKIFSFGPGDTLVYEYDFGSTTSIKLTFVDTVLARKSRSAVELLARNEPFKETCEKCGKPASCFDSYHEEIICDQCAENADEDYLSPITNSPRSCVCGYCGESDIWTFGDKD